jgi:hypothetical protein
MEQEALIKVINDQNAIISELNAQVQVRDELIAELKQSNEAYRVALAETQINKYGEHDE